MLLPSHQLNLAKQYLDKLSPHDKSQQYYASSSPIKLSLIDKVKMYFNIGGYYKQLLNFYPYHPVIKNSYNAWQKDKKNLITQLSIISVLSITLIFQAARRNFVLPLLKKYGSVFGTHRIFRHYVWSVLLPFPIYFIYMGQTHHKNVFYLWTVHSRRLQQKVTSDPNGTQYPQQLLPYSLVQSWITQQVSQLDMPTKLANQVKLQLAPNYVLPEFQAVDFGEQVGEEATEEKQGETNNQKQGETNNQKQGETNNQKQGEKNNEKQGETNNEKQEEQ